MPARFSGRTLGYVDWGWKDGNDFVVRGGSGAVRKTSGYLDRVDYGGKHAIYPAGTRLTVPETTTDGNFGSPLHGTVSGSFVRVAVPDGGVASAEYLPYASGLCPDEFHPRGEDSYERIGGGTGRTLGGVSHSVGKTADKYWCRSDLRYLRSFKAQHHTLSGDAVRKQSAVLLSEKF